MNIFRAFLANQLGFPSGWFGRFLLRLLNRNNAVMNDLVLQELELQLGDRVLEIGFGGGDLIHKIVKTKMPSQIFGVERSPDALTVCQKQFCQLMNQGKAELHLADTVALPFPDHYFNRICTVNTLYFWTDTLQAFIECSRVLIPGGKLVIGYASKTYLEQQKLSQYGFTTYEVIEVEMIMRAGGFTNVETVLGRSDRHEEFFCTAGIMAP